MPAAQQMDMLAQAMHTPQAMWHINTPVLLPPLYSWCCNRVERADQVPLCTFLRPGDHGKQHCVTRLCTPHSQQIASACNLLQCTPAAGVRPAPDAVATVTAPCRHDGVQRSAARELCVGSCPHRSLTPSAEWQSMFSPSTVLIRPGHSGRCC